MLDLPVWLVEVGALPAAPVTASDHEAIARGTTGS